MNVGSILNNDLPPSNNDNDKKSQAVTRPDNQSIHQRHSIVNLLNDPSPSATATSSKGKGKGEEIEEEGKEEEFPQPMSTTVSPSQASGKVTNRNSIVNITNVKDVDIATGKATSINISRQSNFNDINDQESDHGQGKSQSEGQLKEGQQFQSKESVEQEDKHINESGVNNIIDEPEDDELAKLNKLKSSNKPKRYTTPPIWAQGWVSPNSQANNSIPSNGVVSSSLSNKQVFDPTSTVSSDLECSITGVIPPPSVTRTIAEWIYANFNEIPDENRKYVELELKFGTIIDKRQAHRININVSTECIFTDTSSIYFDMGVHEVGWNDMCQFLNKLEKNYQEELRKPGNNGSVKPKRKFNTLESDITDTFYQITARGEQPKSIRISKDNLLNTPRYTAINKQRISDLYIHNPSSMYDLRLSLSFEHPIPENNLDAIMKKNKPTLTRIKKRNSWTHRQTVTRFDMTRVLVPREFKNKAGKSIIEQDQSFEVELEIDTLELFNGFDKFKNGIDAIRFEELVEIFINNARCLNNRVTKLAHK